MKPVGAIESIASRISELSEVVSAIAHSVDEQARAAGDIGRSMVAASGHTQQAATVISAARDAIQEGALAAGQVVEWTGLLSGRAAELAKQVKEFFADVRAACPWFRRRGTDSSPAPC